MTFSTRSPEFRRKLAEFRPEFSEFRFLNLNSPSVRKMRFSAEFRPEFRFRWSAGFVKKTKRWTLAPDAPLHPAGQAPSLEQATNQLNLASGESGSTHMQLTKRPLQGSCQIWVLQLLCVWVESHVTVRVEQAAFFYIFSTLSIAAASDSLVSLVQLAVLDDAPLEFSYCLKVCRQVLDNSVSPCIWKFLFCIQRIS